MDSMRALAHTLELPERTLRRAAAQGLVRGERLGPRRFHTTLSEEAYLRRHWPFLALLRSALRTEPNVRLAVLFGSMATGEGSARSDVDVLVVLADQDVGRLADLSGRLSRRMERAVQLVRLADAERSPLLMSQVLKHGRVLVDRDSTWPRLQRAADRWSRLAHEAETPLEEAAQTLDNNEWGDRS